MRTTTIPLFLTVFLLSASAGAQEYGVSGKTLTITASADAAPVQVALGCTGTSVFVHDGNAYVNCGASGVAVVSLSAQPPKQVSLRDMGGTVTAVFLVDGAVWAQVQRMEAQPIVQGRLATAVIAYEGTAPLTPDTPSKPVAPATSEPEVPVPEAEVIQVRPDDVIVGLGAEHGIKRGDHIEIFVRTEVQFGGETTNKEEQVLIGKVTAVSATRSEVQLGINERVPPGALARPTDARVTSNRVSPPRIGHVWEAMFTARPFLALGTFGFGTISDATLRRRFEGPWSAELRIEPLGLGFADDGNIVSASGNVIGAYDTRLFSVGLGVGWAAINDSVEDGFGASVDAEGDTPQVEFDRVRSGLSIAQAVRLGSQDGLHLAVYNSFLFYSEQFNYGGTTVTLQFPAGEALWVFTRGGGGATGYAFGEIGLRVRVLGSGDSGSLFLSPSVGGGGLFGEKDCDRYEGCVKEIGYGGPLVGLGLEWRQ